MLQTCKPLVTDFEMDELKESVNIGASHASDALSKLVHKTVLLSVPEISICDLGKTVNFIGDADRAVTSMKIKVLSDKNGMMLYLFQEKTDIQILKIINPERPDTEELIEGDLPILSEIGNILSGSFLTAISKFLGVSFMHSVSEVCHEKLRRVVDSAVSEIVGDEDKIMVLKINMEIKDEKLKTSLFFLMDPVFTKNILSLSQKILKS